MIFKFKIVSDEVNSFSREIEIDSENNFESLRNVILDSVAYSKDDPSSFFLCDDDWTMREEIVQFDMGVSSDQNIWIMADTKLSEMVDEEGQKLMFVFDYLDERAFFMELKEIIPGKTLPQPLCTRKEGKAPIQKKEFITPSKPVKTKPVEDIDLDFYGDSDFNPEELGEGFDDFNF